MKGPAFLMTVDTVIRGIHIQNDPGGCALMLIHEHAHKQGSERIMIRNDPTVTIGLLPTALQAVQRGFSGQCRAVRPISRQTARHQAHDRIMTQGIMIVQVFVTQSQPHDPLTDKVFNPVFHKGRMPLIAKTCSKTAAEPQTIINLL